MTKISKEAFLQNAEILKTEIVKKKVQVNDLKQLTDLGIDEPFIDVCLEKGFISEWKKQNCWFILYYGKIYQKGIQDVIDAIQMVDGIFGE